MFAAIASRPSSRSIYRKAPCVPRIAAAASGVFPNNTTTTRGPIFNTIRTKIDLQKERLNTIPPTGTQTKIICTLGPASDQPERILELIQNGMHVARLNFSHAGSDYTYPQSLVDMVRGAKGKHETLTPNALSGEKAPNNLRAILVDTKGPEIRTGPLPGDEAVVQIEVGAQVMLTIEDVQGKPIPELGDTTRHIQIDYQSICKTVHLGAMILLDDGLIALEVLEIDPKGKFVVCQALNAGPIKKNKGVNLPDMELDLPALTEKDCRDLKWSCEVGADYVAASFIRSAANVRAVIAYLDRCVSQLPAVDGEPRIRPLVISKIENKEGVDNFDEILYESDGIMVARGDLGVEIPYSKVFAAQKMMVSKCNVAGKPVIVATQMLDSMVRNPRPTRAEVTDVGTAVLDGTDAVMLSGETAAGVYPIESLKAMASVAYEADVIQDKKLKIIWNQELHDKLSPSDQELDAITASAVKSAMTMKAKAILLISQTGRVARAVARHRPSVPVLSFCTDPQVARRLQLNRAIIPMMLQTDLDPTSPSTRMGDMRAESIRTAKELGFVKGGDRIIFIDRSVGKAHDMHDFAHNMKVVTLRDS
jgi:pyruvate kinase